MQREILQNRGAVLTSPVRAIARKGGGHFDQCRKRQASCFNDAPSDALGMDIFVSNFSRAQPRRG